MVRPVAAAAARQVTLRSHHTAYGTRSPAPTMTKNTEETFSDTDVATSSAMTAGERQPPSSRASRMANNRQGSAANGSRSADWQVTGPGTRGLRAEASAGKTGRGDRKRYEKGKKG